MPKELSKRQKKRMKEREKAKAQAKANPVVKTEINKKGHQRYKKSRQQRQYNTGTI